MAGRKIEGIVTGIFVGSSRDSIVSTRKEFVRVFYDGFEGDRHAGAFRGADVRAKHFPKGTQIWNSRQISIVSEDELEEIAEMMKVPEIKPEWLGANICVKGIPRLTLTLLGSKIFIPDCYGGLDVSFHITAINTPCVHPGAVIQDKYPDINGLESRFPSAAHRRRGVVAVVEHAGCIQEGSKAMFWMPD